MFPLAGRLEPKTRKGTLASLLHLRNIFVHHGPNLHGKIFTLKGTLINNHGHVVEVDGVLSLPNVFILLSEAATILAALVTDPAIAQIGPYTVGNGGTNTVTMDVQKLCSHPTPRGGYSFTTRHSHGTCTLGYSTPSSPRSGIRQSTLC